MIAQSISGGTSMRRLIVIVSGMIALFGSFFLTLWLTTPDTGPSASNVAANRSFAERLAAQRIANYSDLPGAAADAGLRFSEQLKGNIDGIDRVNEHDVHMGGWFADPQGDATPLRILVFIKGTMVAAAETKGERPDVTRAFGLAFGAEKNVAFSFNFNCGPGVQPVVVGVDEKGRYFPLQSNLQLKQCP